jgi:hypothetical protein
MGSAKYKFIRKITTGTASEHEAGETGGQCTVA